VLDALVEVKTGTTSWLLNSSRVIWISRATRTTTPSSRSPTSPAIAGQHPTKVDRRRLTKVALHHYSWSEIVSEAVMQKEHRGIATRSGLDLGELVRYMEHPRSGVLEFQDMGSSWVDIRNAITAGTLRPLTRGIEVADDSTRSCATPACSSAPARHEVVPVLPAAKSPIPHCATNKS